MNVHKGNSQFSCFPVYPQKLIFKPLIKVIEKCVASRGFNLNLQRLMHIPWTPESYICRVIYLSRRHCLLRKLHKYLPQQKQKAGRSQCGCRGWQIMPFLHGNQCSRTLLDRIVSPGIALPDHSHSAQHRA